MNKSKNGKIDFSFNDINGNIHSISLLIEDASPKENIFIDFAIQLKTLSKCKTGNVAAILLNRDFSQIFSIGINGGPTKQDDCLCGAKYGCVHAEMNCLVKNKDTSTEKIMICTKQCCQTCASLIVNSCANVKEFWYLDHFSDTTGIEILRKAGIKLAKIVCKSEHTFTKIYQ